MVETLFQAFDEFKKGKRNKIDVGYFERHLEDNLFQLHSELANKTYQHSAYTGFCITDPKVRHIHKAVVKDRIVHHALFNILNPIFEKTFISDSYSCRKGYGTHKGFKKLVKLGRKLSKNYSQDYWALKCDIRKFFDSVDHAILVALLRARIKDQDVIWLLEGIINSFGEGKGVPIGNLTSQLFANIYLNELDQFVKQELKVKYYLRYADDFVILNSNKEVLISCLNKLAEFLMSDLKLSLHPRKVSLRRLCWGIDFVGYVSLPFYQVVRTKTKKRIFNKIEQKITAYKSGGVEIQTLNQSLQSYFGLLKHANTYNLESELRNNIFFWLNR